MNTPDNVKKIELFAWLGEDERGSGQVGLKQGVTNAGVIPLVAVDGFKMDREWIKEQLQHQVNVYGKTIRLCRFVFVEELETIVSQTNGPFQEAPQ